MIKKIRHAVRGSIKWSVQKEGRTIRESRSYSNLILDQGLDFIASYAFADCFKYCALGSGTVAPVGTDTGLANETNRTNNYAATAESNGATLTNNVFKIFRTFVFPAHLASATYGEVGFSPLATTGGNLFSKALLKTSDGDPTTVTINEGETITVRYDLSIEMFDASRRVNNGLAGVQGGYLRIQKVGLKGVSATGETEDYDDAGACNEPSIAANIFMSANGDAPEPFNSCIDRSPVSSKQGSLSNYVAGSHGRNKGVIFKASEKMSPWRSVGVGSANAHGAIFVFDNQQSADSNKAYFVTFSYYWVHQNESSFVNWLDGDDQLYLNARLNKANTYAYFAL